MAHGRRPVEAILIAGPTASGKSALALRLAQRLNGTIVNADSMQVYRDLRVLTARPSDPDLSRAPHRLYGTIDGAEAFSVSRWRDAVARVLAEVRKDGRLPIVVGGTGLYFKALTQGLSAIPPVPAAIRAEVRTWAAIRSPEALHAELAARDPAAAARLKPSDPQRIARALEVILATGRSLTSYHEARDAPTLAPGDCIAVALTPNREASRRRVDARVLEMVEGGALDEVEMLLARRLEPGLPVMRTLGVAPLGRYLGGEGTLDDAIAAVRRDTRQYLKRQDTFARHQLPSFRPVEPDRAEAFVLDQLV